ncbi:hypothetical protein [Methyloglobulus sp.]|uniref:hypothetical protein n=1 Tax=Methyloglobulus sp. TaxID=2518622 RepID=UPI0032B784E0
MMVTPTRNRINPTSLSAQIKDAEQQVLNRKQKINVGTATLLRKMQQQMIAPTTFLFAAGIGFLLGEITKRGPSKTHATTNQSQTVEISPLKTALSLVTSIQTLYTALPIAWMINTINRRGTSYQVPEQPVHQTMTNSGSSDSV